MNLSPAALLAHARSDAGRRAIRYSMVSVVGVVGTQILLLVLLYVLRWRPLTSNVTAASLMSIPVFLLNKHWVWGKAGRAHLRREVIPFWLFTLAGLAISTALVAVVEAATRTEALPHGNRLAAQLANISGFGLLWVLKFLFLDKIMFGPHHHTPYDEDIELEEAGLEPDLEPR